MKVFIDTNILVDVLEQRQPFYLHSANIIEHGILGDYILVVSPLTIINTLYITRKTLGKDIAKEKIMQLLTYCEIAPMTEKEMLTALSMQNQDTEDNLQYCSAESAQCDVIITRNPKDFPIINNNILVPQDFITKYFQ